MGDEHHTPMGRALLPQHLQQMHFTRIIQIGVGLIENQYGWVAIKGSGQGNPLTLAA